MTGSKRGTAISCHDNTGETFQLVASSANDNSDENEPISDSAVGQLINCNRFIGQYDGETSVAVSSTLSHESMTF